MCNCEECWHHAPITRRTSIASICLVVVLTPDNVMKKSCCSTSRSNARRIEGNVLGVVPNARPFRRTVDYCCGHSKEKQHVPTKHHSLAATIHCCYCGDRVQTPVLGCYHRFSPENTTCTNQTPGGMRPAGWPKLTSPARCFMREYTHL